MSKTTSKTTNIKNSGNTSPIWGGRFNNSPAEIMQQFNASVDFDKIMYKQDIAGSCAHAEMLADCAIITHEEANAIITGLQEIEQEIERGEFIFQRELEDIHMNIEARLHEKIGPVAGKLHTARSRNDQVATDFRMWVRDAIDQLDANLQKLQIALLDKAQQHADSIMPGFTHLQAAQPITMGHHLLAYVEMIARDRERFADARKRCNKSPLGAAALAGTSFPIDREQTAHKLGFSAVIPNSLDAVSDRDFALEFLSSAAICAVHLSRLAEELVLWSTPQFGFVTISDSYATGSSIMPQKKNPDAAELIRGKTGRIASQFDRLILVMKGLPLAYNKDTQEDKEPVFAAAEQLNLCILVMTGMIAEMQLHKDKMRNACNAGFITATDLADWLVKELNIPFRNAHHITGTIVKLAIERGCALDKLPLEAMQKVEPKIHEGVFDILSVESAVTSRTSFGGTAPNNVKSAIEIARKKYS